MNLNDMWVQDIHLENSNISCKQKLHCVITINSVNPTDLYWNQIWQINNETVTTWKAVDA